MHQCRHHIGTGGAIDVDDEPLRPSGVHRPSRGSPSTRVASSCRTRRSARSASPRPHRRPGLGDHAALVHHHHVGAGLLHFGEQVQRRRVLPGRSWRTLATPGASPRFAVGRARRLARRGPAAPACRAWPGRWRGVVSCRGCITCAPCGRSRRQSRRGDASWGHHSASGPAGGCARRAWRLSTPDRCGRKPGPSTRAPTRWSTSAPGTRWCPKTRISPLVARVMPHQHAKTRWSFRRHSGRANPRLVHVGQ